MSVWLKFVFKRLDSLTLEEFLYYSKKNFQEEQWVNEIHLGPTEQFYHVLKAEYL